jgi:hypothetical protein
MQMRMQMQMQTQFRITLWGTHKLPRRFAMW